MKIPLFVLFLFSFIFSSSFVYSQDEKSNKLPVVNLEIGSVSGESFAAPVWLKFYPRGTYDPDGYIVLFEMDMDGDGTYDVIESTLTGGSYEFTSPGDYTASVRVTDDNGGVTTKSQSIIISGPISKFVEQPKIYEPAIESKPENIELDKKLDSIIEDFKTQEPEPTIVKGVKEDVYHESVREKNVYTEPAFTEEELLIIESVQYQDAIKTINDNLIVNGSFEEGSSVGSFKLFSIGDGIPDWTVTRGTVDLVGNYFNSADGNNSLDLNGTSYGEIQQQFSTKKGKQYKLSFYLAGNPGGGPTIKKLLVTVGNKSENYQFDITGKNVMEMGWEHRELIFTAKDKYTILTFESNHNSGPSTAGPVIDNVKVFELEAEKEPDVVKPRKKKSRDKKKSSKKSEVYESIRTELSADSYVYAYSNRNWNDANFGQSEFLGVGWHSIGGEQRGYMKFDLPNINADDLIKAQLKLYIKKTIGKNSVNIGIFNVLESWEEGSGTYHSDSKKPEPIDSSGAITWEYQPEFDDSAFAEFKLRKKRDKFINVDITALVKSWLANNSNYGLLLKPKDSLGSRKSTSIYVIYSKEYKDKSKHPILMLDIKE